MVAPASAWGTARHYVLYVPGYYITVRTVVLYVPYDYCTYVPGYRRKVDTATRDSGVRLT